MATAGFASLVSRIVPFPVPHPVEGALSRVLGMNRLEHMYHQVRATASGAGVPEAMLQVLHVQCDASGRDLDRIPRTGPVVLTVNHPFGILEGAVLAKILGEIRPDVRLLANGMLAAVPEIRDLLIEVDPISGRSAAHGNSRGLRRSVEHLLSGGLLVIFPAGEVSHFRWKERAVCDADWNPMVARLLAIATRRGARVQVVPAWVAGANSLLFQAAGLLHAGLRTALLPRELLNKKGSRVEVRIGGAIAAERLLAIPGERAQMEHLRWRTYLLASRSRYRQHTSRPLFRRRPAPVSQVPIAEAGPAEALAAEVACLDPARRLIRSGDLEVWLAPAAEIPAVLHEIGRLREVTFRAAGEGSGQALDLDEFDRHYLHLFVWNARQHELVGAYRLTRTGAVPAGAAALYTATLFDYNDAFLRKLGPAIELGRSFVRQEYQRAFAPLLLLWKGIGRYVAAHPECKVLFGPVSISNQYQAVSRHLMISFLEKYALLREWTGLVRHRTPFRDGGLKGASRPVLPDAGFDLEDLSAVITDLEPAQSGVPVLLRQYLKLGGKLLGFNVDPGFANALDGLILVDLTRTESKLLERYLGKAEASAFLNFWKGQSDAQ